MNNANFLHIIPSRQQLLLYRAGKIKQTYLIATSKFGLGEELSSYKTPQGWHIIRAKIGAGCPMNSVFCGRRPTGEVYTPLLATQNLSRDWILTRILWLSGIERGKNRLGSVDTMRRFIYIHGTPDNVVLGKKPSSHGCIRMHNLDLLELFAQVHVGEKVFIGETL